MIVNNLSNESYHSDTSSLSSSQLKMLANTPALYHDRYLTEDNGGDKKESLQIITGSMIHCLTLEPTWFDDRYVTVPEGLDRRTKEGKALFAEIVATGKTPITEAQRADAFGVYKSIMRLEISREIFQSEHGVSESSIFWSDEPSNYYAMKCRPDYMIKPCEQFPLGLIVDLKTTRSADYRAFQRQANSLMYDLSAAHYKNGFYHEFGEYPDFYMLAVETKRPYLSRYFRVSDRMTELGNLRIGVALENLAHGENTGEWCGYPEMTDLEPPSWEIDEEESIEVSYE